MGIKTNIKESDDNRHDPSVHHSETAGNEAEHLAAKDYHLKMKDRRINNDDVKTGAHERAADAHHWAAYSHKTMSDNNKSTIERLSSQARMHSSLANKLTGTRMNESSRKIVEAFEILDADKIIESVESVMVQKLIERVDVRKAEIGSKVFVEATSAPLSKDQDWAYDRLETKMKEAVDVVVESLLEGQEDLKTTVKETAKTLGVNESALHEYFETYFLGEAGTTGGAQKDPIDSDDDDPNYSNMNDKDADRKISYEHVVMEELSQLGVIKIGKYNYKVEKADIQPLIEVFHNLNEENQAKLVATLTEDVDGFSRMIEMSKKLTAGV